MTNVAPIQRAMSPGQWAWLVLLSLLWGGSFFFVEVALNAFPPLTLVALRVAIAALLLHAAGLLLRWPLPTGPRIWGAFLVMGLLNNAIPFCLIVWGQTHIASALASVLNATTPLFTIVVAHAFTRDERLTANGAGGVLLGVVGTVILIGPHHLTAFDSDIAAQLAILAAAASYALAAVFGRRFSRLGVPPMATARGQVTASSLLLIPVALLIESPWQSVAWAPGPWAAVLALGSASTALAYILYFRILAISGATNILLVTFLVPVSAILLGTAVLGEVLEARQIAGMTVIALALGVIDGRPARVLTRIWRGRVSRKRKP